MTPDECAQILVTARLLRATSVLSWLAAALVVVATAAIVFVHPSIVAALSIALGLVAIYYGVRVAFDVKVLEDIASERLTTPALDAALGGFAKGDRTWSERCRGAKRLAQRLAIATIAQIVAVVVSAWW